MARNPSRREVRLLVGLGVVVVVWFLMRGGPTFQRGEAAAEADQLAAMADAPTVRMDLLEPRDAEFDQAGRDLFKYGKKPLTAEELARLAAQRRAQEERVEQQRKAAEERRAQAQRPPPQPARRPAGPSLPRIDLTYLGYLGPKDDRIAVFEDGDQVVLARTGEVVKDDFRVVEIQYESVVMGYTRPDLENKTQTLKMARR
jgi:hypothetical protein